MSLFFDCNIDNKKTIIDVINKSKGDNILISLWGLDFKEIISFLHIFPNIQSLSDKRIFAGLPGKYEYIKFIYPNNNFYIVKNEDLRFYESKFPVIIKLYSFELKKSNDKISFIMKQIFKVNDYIVNPIKINVRLNNEYSDIIGISMNKDLSNTTVIDIITNEIIESSLFCNQFYFDLNGLDLINIKESNVKRAKQMEVKIYNPFDSSIVSNINSLISKISECKYFLGYEPDLFLLAYMILGKENCILLDNSCVIKNTFPFFTNIIDIRNGYEKGSVTEMLNKLYSDF